MSEKEIIKSLEQNPLCGSLTHRKTNMNDILARPLLDRVLSVIKPELHPAMKKHLKTTNGLTFGDLVAAVTSVSRNLNEATAAVADLLESGRVRLTSNGRIIRARVA